MVRCTAGTLSQARRPCGHLTVRAPALGRRSGASLRLLAGPRRTRRGGGVEWSNLQVALLGHDGPCLHRFFVGPEAPLANVTAPCFGFRAGAVRATATGGVKDIFEIM